MAELSDRTEQILQWRESLIKLPDYHFFELMRIYLGEVKTPYNKQKLIEELSSFLRKESTKAAVCALLSEKEILVLTAIKQLNEPSQEKLTDLFSSDFSFAELYEMLLNLEERLIIYRHSENKKVFLYLNPLLEESILPYINISRLLPSANAVAPEAPVAFVSSSLLAALYSFCFHELDICKNDGILKKRAEVLLQSVFSSTGSPEAVQSVIYALVNLSLLQQSESRLVPDAQKWEKFAELSEQEQRAYICVASCGHFARSLQALYTKLVLNILAAIPEGGFSKSALTRCVLLLMEKTTGFFFLKRSKLYNALSDNGTSDDEINTLALIENMIRFGLITEKNDVYFANRNSESAAGENQLAINPDYTLTLLPGVPLKDLLPLACFLKIVSYDTVSFYELNRESCYRAFDAGISAETIVQTLNGFSSHGLSQNMLYSINDWFSSYQSIMLYKGYVLKVSKDKASFIETSSSFADLIACKLADGIYLLNIDMREDAAGILKNRGFDYIGTANKKERTVSALPFLSLKADENIFTNSSDFVQPCSDDAEKEKFFSELSQELEKKDFTEEQKEGLLSRIRRKVVLSPVQLRGDSVRFERIEAGGMDFQGKVHIAEHALSSHSMVELVYEDDSAVILGMPVSIEKKEGDAIMKLVVEPDKKSVQYSIGRANSIKRIPGSIFKENGKFS